MAKKISPENMRWHEWFGGEFDPQRNVFIVVKGERMARIVESAVRSLRCGLLTTKAPMQVNWQIVPVHQSGGAVRLETKYSKVYGSATQRQRTSTDWSATLSLHATREQAEAALEQAHRDLAQQAEHKERLKLRDAKLRAVYDAMERARLLVERASVDHTISDERLLEYASALHQWANAVEQDRAELEALELPSRKVAP